MCMYLRVPSIMGAEDDVSVSGESNGVLGEARFYLRRYPFLLCLSTRLLQLNCYINS